MNNETRGQRGEGKHHAPSHSPTLSCCCSARRGSASTAGQPSRGREEGSVGGLRIGSAWLLGLKKLLVANC